MKGLPGRGALAVGVAACLGALVFAGGAATQSGRDEQPRDFKSQVPPELKQARLDSQLAGLSRTNRLSGQSAALVTARAKGLDVKGGRVRTVIVAHDASQAAARVAAEGGVVEATYQNRVQALLPPAAFDRLSNDPSVGYLRPPLTPVPDAILGEGVAATGAAAWHAAGREGAGVKVAVIDLGFAGYLTRQAEGELPGSLTTVDLCDGNFATDEPHGTGVAEVVHEMAPDAELTLICINSEVQLGQAEEYAKSHGIKVVNHSVGWFNAVRGDGKGGPGTIDGIVADARANGILWVNAAGNQAQDHWSGIFNDPNGDGAHNFTSNDVGNTFLVPNGWFACVVLKWDAWPTTSQDFDLYLPRSSDGALFAASTSLQNGTQTPTEGACFLNDTGIDDWFYAEIDRFSGTAKPRMDMVVMTGGFFLQYQTSAGSINEIAASPNTFAAAAICYQTNALEPFSSRGPTIDNRVKPDIAAPDGVSNATYGNADGCQSNGFFGTSAASPHVAGAAALVLGQSPGLSVTQLQSALTSAAAELGPAGKDNSFGSGRLRVPSIVAPVVSSFAPAAGPVGSTVTINGSALTGATAVTFNGVPATTFTVVAANKITATVPAGASTGQIAVTTPNGTGTSAGSFKVTPKVTGFNPTSAIRGASIQIEGTTFTGTTAVKFGTVVALGFVVDDDSHITVPVPLPAVTNKVSVTTPAGTGTSVASFTVILPPTISGFSPAAGPVGATVTVNGSNLSSATSASLNGLPVTIIPVSATQLKFVVPPGAQSGQIQVTNAAGPVTSAGTFKVTPKVNSFTPPSAIRGTSIQIEGTTFTGTTAVKFGTVVAPGFVVDDDSHITVPVPSTAVTNKVSVTTPAGTGTSVGSFTVVLPPTISGFSPAAGPVGTLVTVNGTNLSSVTSASFDGQPATITPVSATQLKITIPAGTHTSGVQLTNAAGPVTSAATFKVTPKVNSFDPLADVRGASIKILGSTFNGATTVKFGTVSATTFTVDDDSTITVSVPPTATTNKVSVTTPAGTGTSVGNFTVILPPTISSFSPAAGSVGTVITVTGTNLLSITSASIDGVVPPITPVSATQLKLTVPADVFHTGYITLTNAAGSVMSATPFKSAPKVSSFTPTSGVRGSWVSIHGDVFTGATAVKFGSVPATFQVWDHWTIAAEVPSTATSGKISVTTPGGTGASLSNFTVILPPTISSFSPTSGVAGTVVTINGANLTGPIALSFNGVDASSITPVSATQVKATVPPGATTGKIALITIAGTALSGANFSIPLAITSISATSGSPGDTIVITGVGFLKTWGVKFGNGTAGGTIDSDNQLTVTVPADGTDGPVVVSNGTASTRSAVLFDVIGWPPVSAPVPSPRKIADPSPSDAVSLPSVAAPRSATAGDADIRPRPERLTRIGDSRRRGRARRPGARVPALRPA
jgi:hypothetical protein